MAADGLDKYLDKFAPKKPKAAGDDSVARVLDDEFAKLGYGDTARLSILGDVGRENAWDRKTIFGGHNDPKNNARNRGIISWQGDRSIKLDKHLKKEGVYGRGDDEELRGMARFMDSELKTDFPDVHKSLMNAKGTYDASEALRKYIKYVPNAPYNTPDDEFRVKNNADWAKRAKSLGLAQKGLDDYLDRMKGGATKDGLDDYLDKLGQPTPTNPTQQPLQTGLKPLLQPGQPLAQEPAEMPITVPNQLPVTSPVTLDRNTAKTPQTLQNTPKSTPNLKKGLFSSVPPIPEQPRAVPPIEPDDNSSRVIEDDFKRPVSFREKPADVPNREWVVQQLVPEIVAKTGYEAIDVEKQLRQGFQNEYGTPLDKIGPDGTWTFEMTPDFADAVVARGEGKRNALANVIATGQDITDADKAKMSKSLGLDPAEIDAAIAGQGGWRYQDAVTQGAANKQFYAAKQAEYAASLAQGEPASIAQIKAAADVGWLKKDEADKAIAKEQEIAKNLLAENRISAKLDLSGIGQARLGAGTLGNGPVETQADYAALNDILKKYGTLANYEKEQKDLVEKYGYLYAKRPLAPALEFAKRFGNAVPQAVSSILETIAIAGEMSTVIPTGALDYFAGTDLQKQLSAENSPLYKIGKDFGAYFDDLKNKDFDDNKLISVVSDTLGQIAVQILAGVASGGATVPTALGAAMGASQQYEDAAKFTQDPTARLVAASVGAAAAIPDAIIFNQWFKGLGQGETQGFLNNFAKSMYSRLGMQFGDAAAEEMTRVTMKTWANNLIKGSLFEGAQEVSENKINDALALAVYDRSEARKKKLLSINQEDIASFIGGLVGGFGGGVVETRIEQVNEQKIEDALTYLPDLVAAGKITAAQAAAAEPVLQEELQQRKKGSPRVREFVQLQPIEPASNPNKNNVRSNTTLTNSSEPVAETPVNTGDEKINPNTVVTNSNNVVAGEADPLDTYIDQIKVDTVSPTPKSETQNAKPLTNETQTKVPAQSPSVEPQALVSDTVPEDKTKPVSAPVTDKTATDDSPSANAAEVPQDAIAAESSPEKPTAQPKAAEPTKPRPPITVKRLQLTARVPQEKIDLTEQAAKDETFEPSEQQQAAGQKIFDLYREHLGNPDSKTARDKFNRALSKASVGETLAFEGLRNAPKAEAPARETDDIDITLDKIRKGSFGRITDAEMSAIERKYGIQVLYGGLTKVGKQERIEVMADDILDRIHDLDPDRLSSDEKLAARKRIAAKTDKKIYQATKRLGIYNLYEKQFGELPTRHIKIDLPIALTSLDLIEGFKGDPYKFYVEIAPNDERGEYEDFDAKTEEEVVAKLRELAERDKKKLSPRSVEILQNDNRVLASDDARYAKPEANKPYDPGKEMASAINMDAITPENIDQISAMFDKKPQSKAEEADNVYKSIDEAPDYGVYSKYFPSDGTTWYGFKDPNGAADGKGNRLTLTADEARADADKARQSTERSKQAETEQATPKPANAFTEAMSPMQRGKAEKALSKVWNVQGKHLTTKEYIDQKFKDGTLELDSYEENRIKDMTRRQYNRATNEQQAAHEKKVREGGKVTKYLVNGLELGKTAYDYAQHLSASVEADPENRPLKGRKYLDKKSGAAIWVVDPNSKQNNGGITYSHRGPDATDSEATGVISVEAFNRRYEEEGAATTPTIKEIADASPNISIVRPDTKAKSEEVIPHDGWRGHLIKSRDYANRLGIRDQIKKGTTADEELENLTTAIDDYLSLKRHIRSSVKADGKMPSWDEVMKDFRTEGVESNVVPYDKRFPVVQQDKYRAKEVDGLTVRDEIPNQDSIGATFNDYTVLKKIREVSMSEFDAKPNLNERTKALAQEIKDSGEINPLIVALDDSNEPYILEGQHRFEALLELGVKSFPAMVVIDLDNPPPLDPARPFSATEAEVLQKAYDDAKLLYGVPEKKKETTSNDGQKTEPAKSTTDLFREKLAKLKEEQAKKDKDDDDGWAELDSALGLKSVLPTDEAFDETRYATYQPIFKKIVSKFDTTDPGEQMETFLRKMNERYSLDVIAGLEPYVVRFFDENVLQSEADKSKTPVEAENNADRKNTIGDDRDVDEGESPVDVSGSSDERATKPSGPRSSDSRNGDVSADAQSGDREVVDSKQPSAKGTKGKKPDQSGDRDSDSTSNGLPDGRTDSNGRDYIAPVGGLTREGSWKDAAKTNLDIIELVKTLEKEDRLATPEEQQLLVKYTGWGASELSQNLFSTYPRAGWEDLHKRIRELLDDEEMKTAKRSTQYAHYTSEKIIRGIWTAFEQFGFKGGRVLEPGMGVGLFASAAPKAVLDKSRYTGIEMDHMTARIAKQILQRQTVLEADYVKQKLPDNFFDVAIGNPPFGDITILDDPKYKKYRFRIHDYFFAKSIDKVRPGGVLVFVTSKGTMDKGDTKMREYISERADMLGAIRLPQTAFKQNAGTEVVTDVLFFRKRLPGEAPAGQDWINRAEVTAKNSDDENFTGLVNEYFVNNPEMVLGEHSFTGSMRHGNNEYTVTPRDGDIEEQFAKAIKNLPSAVYADIAKADEIAEKVAERDWNPKAKKEGSLYIHDDGRLMRRDDGSGVAIVAREKISANDEKWLRSYTGLRDALKQAQYDQLQEGDWKKSLAELNKVYDTFVKKHGPILAYSDTERVVTDAEGRETVKVTRRFKNNKLLSYDVESPLVFALERINEDGKIVKSKTLTERQIKPPQSPVIRTLSDALAVSLDRTGSLNLKHVEELIKPVREMTQAEIIAELGDSIYEDPSGGWQMADEYLSGYVKQKLAEAETAAKIDKKFQRNVEALIKAQPAPLLPANIQVGLGSPWVSAEYITQFAQEELEFGRYNDVTFNALSNTFTVAGASGSGSQTSRDASATWGTADRSPQELLEAALNNKVVKIYRTTGSGATKKTELDKDASASANDLIKKMRDSFKRWVWADGDRARDLAGIYNEVYNNIAERSFNGDHLTLPGLSAVYKLHPHQARVVWRILQTGNTYLAHAVGAGKTLEMIVSAMEQKRLGLISKPMFAVPNHMLKQFASEFLDAYPMANIMVADEQNFHKDNRRRFVAQAALNDLDAVIVTHSAFGLLRARPETGKAVVDDLIAQMQMAIEELTDERGNPIDRNAGRTIKQLEKRIEQIERRFGGFTNDEKRDNVVDFEDLGVDFLYIDEAHEFRKLDFVTNRENTKGIDANGSQRALDLLIKARYLNTQRPGRALVLASGTPVTNTLAELYSIQRYMDPQELEESGLSHFDAWASQFGEAAADYEMNAAGNYELVERFSKFVNIPELMKRVRKFMDVLSLRQLGDLVDLPTIKGGQAEIVINPASEETSSYLKNELAARIETSREWKPSPGQPGNPDPLINIITDGRLAAIDMRYVKRGAPNDPNSKLNKMIDKIIEKHFEYKDIEYTAKDTGKAEPVKGAAQIVFSAVGFGAQVAANRGFDAKGWMLQRFTEAGIDPKEVAFMSDYKTNASKEAMFKEMRQGTKRILIGSPKNMGTGVNVQKRLKVLHFLSPPWYPADVEQPDGRQIRQGNQNEDVENYRYATKGTYDATAWQMVARKSRSIEQAMTGDDSQRTLEDISESSQYEMASALAAGDERAIRLAGLRGDIERLERLKGGHRQEQQQLDYDMRRARSEAESDRKHLKRVEDAIALVGDYVSSEDFKVTVGGATLGRSKEFGDKSRADIGEAIKPVWEKAFNKAMLTSENGVTSSVEIGKVQGQFPLLVQTHQYYKGNFNTRLALETGDIHHNVSDWFDYSYDTSFDNIDSTGTATRIYNALNSLSKMKSDDEESIRKSERQTKQIQSKLGQPFADEQELFDKIAEFTQLQAEMASDGAEVPENMTAEEIGQLLLIPGSREDGEPGRIDALSNDERAVFNEAYRLTRLQHPLKSVLAVEPSQNPFYSQLERTIEAKMPAKASADQVRGIIKDTKAEEREWLGIDEWLGDRTVTKDEVLAFVRENNVDVQEVVKGEIEDDQVAAWWNDEGGANQEVPWEDLTPPQQAQARADFRSDVVEWDLETPHTKYSQWTLPGGENYRELLITMPPSQESPLTRDQWLRREGLEDAWRNANNLQDRSEANRLQAIYEKARKAQPTANYRSGHFEEPNILAHLRFDERTVDGKKTLHIAEIQSDFGQQLRKERGKIEGAINTDFEAIVTKMAKAGEIDIVC